MSRILPIVLIVLSAALGYLYIYPTWNNDIATVQQQITNYQQALHAADTFDKEEKKLIAKRDSISQADQDKLMDYMPNSVDNIQLILDLNTLANSNGITLSNFSLQSGSTGAQNSSPTASSTGTGSLFNSSGGTNSLDLSVNASGTYSSFLNFLSSVELSQRPLDVVNLSLTSPSTYTGVYTYSMTFQIYWLAS